MEGLFLELDWEKFKSSLKIIHQRNTTEANKYGMKLFDGKWANYIAKLIITNESETLTNSRHFEARKLSFYFISAYFFHFKILKLIC